MRHLLTIILCCLFVAANANKPATPLLWESHPSYTTVLPEFAGENVIGLLLDERLEYYHNDEGNFLGQRSIHKKFRINNEQSINDFNKISVSMADVLETVDIKARVIKPDGKIVEFDKNNIKEIKDEESGDAYKIFAIDGIEVGDDVEFYVVTNVTADNFGRFFLQYSYPVQKVNFELITPETILYDFKGYNGCNEVSHTVMDDKRNVYSFSEENIKGIKDEKFSYDTPRRQRLEYRLDYNLNKSRAQVLSWDEAAQRLYDIMYLDPDPKVMKKWFDDIKLTATDNIGKVKQIEDYLKSNVYIQEFHSSEFDDISFVYDKKMTSGRGMTGLMVKLFAQLGIDHEIVITSPRDKVKFDPDFQSWNYLDKFLIYIPETDQYIDPAAQGFRLGCFNGMLADEYGLAVERVNIGSFQSAIGKIKHIDAPGPEANYNNMYIQVDVDPDEALAKVDTYVGFKGLSGGFVSQFYKVIDEDQKKNMLKNMMVISVPENDILSVEKGEAQANQDKIADAEMIVHSKVASTSFVEQAGNKLLLHLGNTIGPQAEMYFEEDRDQQAENEFNRTYYREIVFNVPDGYRIKNPEAAIMSVVEKDGDKPVFVFNSSYSYEGQQYKVVIDEYYSEITVPEERFEGFKNVVNAAADFNKVVLVLEPM
ncbi:DUF3857 domain-containing protein [Mangrovibacterium diazotrophicum]|uniref:Uncharacterized protein DUF3857 n=1 Tax=Mangrovibacterium diazotrophicum TaxID=1261403 RepID=A0A419VUC3_9BACT|nr:DUF3857 domain-containing protein [Mangrovibacterium diazotrophicum]RKD85099.1 uncharacterized protein DUF3857 [Mangrovibacterium diazotrophicum]